MKTSKETQLKRYGSFLHDVYETKIATIEMCKKHKINVNTLTSMRRMCLIDRKGNSKMQHKPNIRTVQSVISNNKEYQKKYHQAKRVESKPRKPIVKTHTKEINLFWGMIKIIR
jgi:hypothetical protein